MVIERGFSVQIGRERDLRIDGEGAAAGEFYDHVGALAVGRILFEEIALGGHAGELGYPAEGELAPAASGVGGAEGLGESYGFAA